MIPAQPLRNPKKTFYLDGTVGYYLSNGNGEPNANLEDLRRDIFELQCLVVELEAYMEEHNIQIPDDQHHLLEGGRVHWPEPWRSDEA